MGNIKLVIIVRMDLGMGKGKIAAQVGHASVTASMNKNSQWINKWLDMGQPKIVLKVPGPVELDQIKKDAITLAVPWCVIEDDAEWNSGSLWWHGKRFCIAAAAGYT